MSLVRYDKYYTYAELKEVLEQFRERYPHLIRLQVLGRSHEGRELHLAVVSNLGTEEEADQKPALWVDGNIHATELAPSTACLHLIETLLEGYGKEREITHCLDTRTFYICPRLNPDGAEWALAPSPRFVRSGVRPYPFRYGLEEGLVVEDVDGDGRVLSMRIPDPNGAWKKCPQQPRLMVPRQPEEVEGEFYRILPEGRILEYDGATIGKCPPKEGLDFNRNFPFLWRPEGEQEGAGEFPTSEPEVRAVVAFLTSHPNITGAVSFHTHSGVLLRPYSHLSDEQMIAEDLGVYRAIGKKGEELTGYPAVSVYEGFRYHPQKYISGAFDDWVYEHLGIYAWTVEMWSPQRQAGIEDYDFIEWYRSHLLEDDLKLLHWSDTALGGQGYVDWYPFDHPQLGKVELGGWDWFSTFSNPPFAFLKAEVERYPRWLVWHLLLSPRLELWEVKTKYLGEDFYRVQMVVQNKGWLPSYITKKALERKITEGVRFELELLSEGMELISGKRIQLQNELEGRCYQPSAPMGWEFWLRGDLTRDRAKAEWVVRVKNNATARLTAYHPRAGSVQTTLEWGGDENKYLRL
ncbi:MAG: carboxypeptidase [Planctomycetota bacterium]|nr:MAG: carboxypeptidase [Planctomycetota bacterium]